MMTNILKAQVASIVRHALTMAAAYFGLHGDWIEAASLALVGLGWALYQKYAAQRVIQDALELPAGSTLSDLKWKGKWD